jgi:uncharacterized protein (TIGR02246 family)
MNTDELKETATRYTAAWCSKDPARVASCYSENGSLTINNGQPARGRAAITAATGEFMTTFPDMTVTMDDVSGDGNQAIYRWTLDGTNDGHGGNGNRVRISGYEEWLIANDGLIAASKGHFDEAEYQRQLGQL